MSTNETDYSTISWAFFSVKCICIHYYVTLVAVLVLCSWKPDVQNLRKLYDYAKYVLTSSIEEAPSRFLPERWRPAVGRNVTRQEGKGRAWQALMGKAEIRTEAAISGNNVGPPGSHLNARTAQAIGWDPFIAWEHSFAHSVDMRLIWLARRCPLPHCSVCVPPTCPFYKDDLLW